MGTISNCPYVSNRKPKESPEGIWLDKVQLTVPHVGCGLEHRRQRQLLQEARPGCRQLPDSWGPGRTVWDRVCSEPSEAGCPYPLPTYLGGPFAAASSGPAARPRQHWTAGALLPGRGSEVAPLPPGLPVVGIDKGDTTEESGELLLPPWPEGPSIFPHQPEPTKPCS